MITDINSEDRLVQETFADYLRDAHGWESVYGHNNETFGHSGMLGRDSEREVVLSRDLLQAVQRLNPEMPEVAHAQAVEKLSRIDFSRSLVQHNLEFYDFIRNGVPVEWRDAGGNLKEQRARVIDFKNGSTNGQPNNRFLAVRELKIQGVRVPHYNRRGDLVCFVNGLPLVFIELKAVYRNIRAGFDENLTDYLSENSIQHAFHHNVFLVVSNGDAARYGSITSQWDHFAEWKRNDEKAKGDLDAKVLLDGMLAKDRLLDLVENFILFDNSRMGGTRKVVARNHQVLGVNNALESVWRQEELKREFPIDKRLTYRVVMKEVLESDEPRESDIIEARDVAPVGDADSTTLVEAPIPEAEKSKKKRTYELPLIERAHPDLGRLGVFWHTQGSGKSYSMAFFAEKVRRVVPGNFTFVIMTDREDLDGQIWGTFRGCGFIDDNTPRASSGKDLKQILQQNHRYVFSLIHKFNQDVKEPYSIRDDIIVISDEAHRSQGGRFARNMRLALPNASFIGFTGTPLLKRDHLTRQIFGSYISRYDFKRSEEDHSTVKLIYKNRGEKLGVARLDLNDRIAEAIEKQSLDPSQTLKLESLLGKDYEVITADDRLDKVADDFVEQCAARWDCGKSMLVCIDKITCGRMFLRIDVRWRAKQLKLDSLIVQRETELAVETDPDEIERRTDELLKLRGQSAWMASTIIEIIISEAQNEVRDFAKWGVDIIPHRVVMKTGFGGQGDKRIDVETAFKDAEHPFRVAIVCAMWLTGFDVESLSTLYIDKPMKSHTLMQAIARANRIAPDKDCGVIVDYNGMLKSLRAALAVYAVGDDDDTGDDKPGDGGDCDDDGVAIPIEDLVLSLAQSIEAAEIHLKGMGFDPERLVGAKGFPKIQLLRDARNLLLADENGRRRFEIIAREIFLRFRTLMLEPSVFQYAERRDNLEAIYKKLLEHRDLSDVTNVLKELHKIVNEAIQTQGAGNDDADDLTVDLSQIDFVKLRDEFAKKVKRKHAALQDIRDVVDQKLMQMLAFNPLRMDYYRKYTEIVADYNREKDRVTVEETFAKLAELAANLDAEQRRAAEEGLTEHELALFDLLFKENITKVARERLKQASKQLLATLVELLSSMQDWTKNAQTQAEVKTCIMDNLWTALPRPPFSDQDCESLADRIYDHVWQRSTGGRVFAV